MSPVTSCANELAPASKASLSAVNQRLMFGGNLPNTNQFTIDLISNKEVLEVNQNSWNNKPVFESDNEKIWTAENEKGTYVAFFNLTDKDREISISLKELDLKGTYFIRDLWAKETERSSSDSITVKIAPHGAKIYLIFK